MVMGATGEATVPLELRLWEGLRGWYIPPSSFRRWRLARPTRHRIGSYRTGKLPDRAVSELLRMCRKMLEAAHPESAPGKIRIGGPNIMMNKIPKNAGPFPPAFSNGALRKNIRKARPPKNAEAGNIKAAIQNTDRGVRFLTAIAAIKAETVGTVRINMAPHVKDIALPLLR